MVILAYCGLMVIVMRLLPLILLAGLPCAALAQDSMAVLQKVAQGPLLAPVTAADLGTPANADAPKTAVLTGSRVADAAPSDFDTDKIAGNAEVTAPLTLRSKAASMLPETAPTAAALGTGPDTEKLAVLAVEKAVDGRATSYDTDKIDGNPETYAPLVLRQKAPGQVPDGVAEADFGLPANPDLPKTTDLAFSRAEARPTIYDEDKIDGNEPPPAPLAARQKAPSLLTATLSDADLGIGNSLPAVKTADLAVFVSDSVPSIYDEDKIAGNEETFASGPLGERQKMPSELTAGTDVLDFGQPAIDAPKGDLAVSKAEISQPNIEDNDKIVGNPFVAPPILPRQKEPSLMPDPVADADMGQPAIDAPKVALAVSKAAIAVPTFDDNDKIAGNPVISPPLPDRAKAPAWEPALAGLSDAELGLPIAPEAVKTAVITVSRTADAVPTQYDEDKIAGNTSQDPAFGDEYGTERYETAPPPELIAAVRSMLDDPATRSAMLQAVAARGMAPAAVSDAFAAFIGALFDAPAVRARMATDMARVFTDMGLTPDNPAAVGRMAAEYIAPFGEAEARGGMQRLPIDEQRAYLAGLLRIAETLTPEQCGPYLAGTMDATQGRRLMLTAIADWPEADRNALLIQRAAAAISDLQNSPFDSMPDADAQAARAAIGAAALTAIDAAENADALLSAFGDPTLASPADHCAVQKLILQAAVADTGPDADLSVRYLVQFGWQG